MKKYSGIRKLYENFDSDKGDITKKILRLLRAKNSMIKRGWITNIKFIVLEVLGFCGPRTRTRSYSSKPLVLLFRAPGHVEFPRFSFGIAPG